MNKIIGCILMILGTSIGAGMLALPVAAAHEHYGITIALLTGSWFAMTVGAFSILEVTLWMPPGANIITMAKSTLGSYGKMATWITYLILLYSLLCAYLSGNGDLLQALLASVHIHIPRAASTILALLLLGIIVYRGISSIDIVNQSLMGIKLIAYVILVLAIAPHIAMPNVLTGDVQLRSSSIMVMLTSFGYAIIVPSLCYYLKKDVKQLKKVVLIGSLLPLIIYAIWIAAIQGLLHRHTLLNILSSSNTNSLLMQHVSTLLHNKLLMPIAKLFISICAVTSFLGVSLCLTDFIADGLQTRKQGKDSIPVYAISYIPPLLIVLFAPGIFIKALGYAGICCVLILILLPLGMLYSGRYIKQYQGEKIVYGGKYLLITGIVLAIALGIYGLI